VALARPAQARLRAAGGYGRAVPQAPDIAGSARARLRLVAVVLLGLITGYLVVNAFGLMLLAETAVGAVYAVWIGVVLLAIGVLYGLSAWWVARRLRWGHIVAIVVTGLGFLLSFGTLAGWAMWVAALLQLATLLLLVLTVPRR
jgi:hypothetical protein